MFLHVGRDVNSLSDGRGNEELGALARRAAFACNPRQANPVAVSASHPIAMLPVGRVVVEIHITEFILESNNAHEENTRVLVSKAYCLCVRRIVSPVWI